MVEVKIKKEWKKYDYCIGAAVDIEKIREIRLNKFLYHKGVKL